jgi:GNAT superfamily N-acetyltransferase
MDLRPAKAADVPDLFRVRTSVHENHQSEEELAGLGVTRESLASMLGSGAARGWCAEEDGGVVGFSMARRSERDVFALFVLPEFEGRGIGSALLEAAVAWLRQEGDQPIRLSTGRGTRAFSLYIARGWREVGSLENGDPILEVGV